MMKNLVRRSVLYMPASNARALEKARSLPADCLIFDLEDAVAPAEKSSARALLLKALKQGGYGHREKIIRINPLESEWGQEDLKIAILACPDAILLPKTENAQMVQRLEQEMAQLGADKKIKIWCMMETPRGMLQAEQIAGASPLISAFVMGTSDLVKDLQAKHTLMRLPIITSLGLCLLAARAQNIDIIDGVYLDLQDTEGYEQSCLQGMEMGFDGKTLIHPQQISKANKIFMSCPEELEFSEKIIRASFEANERGEAVVVVEGKLIEHLHVAEAKRLLAKAKIIKRNELMLK